MYVFVIFMTFHNIFRKISKKGSPWKSINVLNQKLKINSENFKFCLKVYILFKYLNFLYYFFQKDHKIF